MTDSADTDYVTLGKLGAPYGVEGWIRLISYTEPAENVLTYRNVRVRLDGRHMDLEIARGRPQGKHFIILIRGCSDRDEVRRYTGCDIQVEKAQLPQLDENQFYWHQLSGMQVINLQDQELGRVDHLMETGANDVLVVKPTPGSIDENQRLIPYAWERIVKQVDPDLNRITVDWPGDY